MVVHYDSLLLFIVFVTHHLISQAKFILYDFKKGQQFLFQQAQNTYYVAYQLHVGILFSYHLQYNKT